MREWILLIVLDYRNNIYSRPYLGAKYCPLIIGRLNLTSALVLYRSQCYYLFQNIHCQSFRSTKYFGCLGLHAGTIFIHLDWKLFFRGIFFLTFLHSHSLSKFFFVNPFLEGLGVYFFFFYSLMHPNIYLILLLLKIENIKRNEAEQVFRQLLRVKCFGFHFFWIV